ncbi:MAG: hypothetical protein M0R77_07840 [Gammaproteobacteria bacterium]|nr:hypothetical protein [Gammaproteobacteria bacterium]
MNKRKERILADPKKRDAYYRAKERLFVEIKERWIADCNKIQEMIEELSLIIKKAEQDKLDKVDLDLVKIIKEKLEM